jgi:O-antigen/teichoic acid export membrane protein
MRNKIAAKNGIIILMCQVPNIILGFVIRKLFIQYIGIEILGVSGTFLSLLSTLSIAEMGFESAIIYSLFKPMKDGSKSEIEDIISILKRIYQYVGVFVLVAGLVMSLFLSHILNGIEVNSAIYISFYCYLSGSAVTYFFAYKGTFLLAHQKDYVRSLYATVYKIVAAIVQLALIVKFQSFILFAAVSIVQNFMTNYSISRYVDKHYDYNFNQKINMSLFKNILKNVKDIFLGKMAGYVYSSTDNILISVFVNTLSVGLLGNYTQILIQLKTVINNAFISTKPIIGHFLATDADLDHTYQILKNYTFLRFVIVVLLFVPSFVLCDSFISIWLGQNYVLSIAISLLLVTDIFIHFVHGALVDYIAGLGYFRQDRQISIIGAILNLTLSILLVNSIGISGVLIGTVVSQSFFWISRSVIVFKTYFKELKDKFLNYWLYCIGCIFIFYTLCFLNWWVFKQIPMEESYLKFLVGGIVCCLINIPIILLVFARTNEFKYLSNMIKKRT